MVQRIGTLITLLLMTGSLFISIDFIEKSIPIVIDERTFQILLYCFNGIASLFSLFFLVRWFNITNKNRDLLHNMFKTRLKFYYYCGRYFIIAIVTMISVFILFKSAGVTDWKIKTISLMVGFPLLGIFFFPTLTMIFFTSNNFKYVVQFWRVRNNK